MFTRYSPDVCNATLKVVEGTISDGLKEEISLTIEEKLIELKQSASKIINITEKYHDGINTGIDCVNNVLISVSFDMGWPKKIDHTYDPNSGHAYFIGCRSGKVVSMLMYSKNAQSVMSSL